jgi:hypothetical protein
VEEASATMEFITGYPSLQVLLIRPTVNDSSGIVEGV